jgi:hypothetical protein
VAGWKNGWEYLSTGVVGYGKSRVFLGNQLVSTAYLETLVAFDFYWILVPPGSIINSAVVKFVTDVPDIVLYNNVTTVLSIFGEKTDDPKTFSSQAASLSSRPRTNAIVTWESGQWRIVGESGVNQTTADISSIIQELVDMPSWVLSDTIILLMQRAGSVSVSPAPGHAATKIVKLNIDFTRQYPTFILLPFIDCSSDHRNYDHHNHNNNDHHDSPKHEFTRRHIDNVNVKFRLNRLHRSQP